MQTLESLQRKINTSHELLSVVKTMKSLAAVNIRRYELAAAAMDSYYRIVEKGWQALFRDWRHLPATADREAAVCLVLGSDQGMCGQFNERVLERVAGFTTSLREKGFKLHFWAIGERLLAGLAEKYDITARFDLPGSIEAISYQIHAIVESFGQWRQEHDAGELSIIHNRQDEHGTGFAPVVQRVLPLDRQWLKERQQRPWPTSCLPQLGLPKQELFDQLLQQYLFASIFRAFAQSMASENAARLAAMQAAEKNIREMEERLQASYREARQQTITS